jgi:putative PIN family toxin of toxin-antitoxin system
MKILLDTNVLLSAAWRDRLPEKIVLHVATDRECQWIVTAPILQEYLEVLKRPKFALPTEHLQQWAELIEMRTFMVPTPTVDVSQLRDPKDIIFLAAAVATAADFLVTGDRDLLQAQFAGPTRIVTVADFSAALNMD